MPKAEQPCPFCGMYHIKYVASTNVPGKNLVQVECLNCAARGPTYRDENSAMSAWNNGEYGYQRTPR